MDSSSEPIRFVLLGGDAAITPLLSAIAADDRCSLTGCVWPGERQADVMRLFPVARVCESGPDLLPMNPDYVIVAGAGTELQESARQLASNEHALVILPLAKTQSVFSYELSIIRDDSGVTLIPILPMHLDPQVCALREAVRSSSQGRALHLKLTRFVPGVSLLTQDVIDHYLLNDCDVLRFVGGNYNQVTAIHTGRTDNGVASAMVNLAGDEIPEAAWQAQPAPDANEERWTLEVVFDSGQQTISGSLPLTATKTVTSTSEETESKSETSLATEFLNTLIAAHHGEPASNRATWTDLTRAFEIVDVSHDSLRRRRTLDLHFETTSERSLFKTQMTAIGCGVMTWTLFGLVAYLIAGAVFGETSPPPPPDGVDMAEPEVSPFRWVWITLRVLWILPLVVFMVLQLLLALTRPATPAEVDSAE